MISSCFLRFESSSSILMSILLPYVQILRILNLKLHFIDALFNFHLLICYFIESILNFIFLMSHIKISTFVILLKSDLTLLNLLIVWGYFDFWVFLVNWILFKGCGILIAMSFFMTFNLWWVFSTFFAFLLIIPFWRWYDCWRFIFIWWGADCISFQCLFWFCFRELRVRVGAGLIIFWFGFGSIVQANPFLL